MSGSSPYELLVNRQGTKPEERSRLLRFCPLSQSYSSGPDWGRQRPSRDGKAPLEAVAFLSLLYQTCRTPITHRIRHITRSADKPGLFSRSALTKNAAREKTSVSRSEGKQNSGTAATAEREGGCYARLFYFETPIDRRRRDRRVLTRRRQRLSTSRPDPGTGACPTQQPSGHL